MTPSDAFASADRAGSSGRSSKIAAESVFSAAAVANRPVDRASAVGIAAALAPQTHEHAARLFHRESLAFIDSGRSEKSEMRG